ncbi:Kinase-like protein [Mycena sanguinolenta]|uniref:Kinase-like protein n=1 Tax=Mycena sanguinolenta TaxID=230812 RepID=A0A8H7CV51_9AGAR|nr:Kinase-like protein [Mycena sanguinolenta]
MIKLWPSVQDPQLTPRASNNPERNPFDDPSLTGTAPPRSPTTLYHQLLAHTPDLSTPLASSGGLATTLPSTSLSLHAPEFFVPQPPKPLLQNKFSVPQTSSSAQSGGSGSTSKGQIHVKLIQARGLHVNSTAKPYVVVQFEQNEAPPTTVATSSAMSALGAIGSKAAVAEARRRDSKGSNNSSHPSPASSVPSASVFSNGGGLFGRGLAHNPIWKHEVSFDVTSEASLITFNVYDRADIAHSFLGTVQIKPVLVHDHTVDQWYKLRPCENEVVSGDLRVQVTFEQYRTKRALGPRDFEFLKLLGRGTFGQVSQAREKDTKRKYPMKVPSKKENKGHLNRNSKYRLGAVRDAKELKGRLFLSSIDWEALARKQVTPPFKPIVESDESEKQTADLDDIFTLTNLHDGGLAEMDFDIAEADRSASSPPGGYIESLLTSWERCVSLRSMTMLSEAGHHGPTQVRKRLGDIEAQIGTLLIQILDSRAARRAAEQLESDRAQHFVDAIQDALDRGTIPDSSSRSKARHLIQKVSEAREQLPSSLFIEGVNDHDEHPTFGGGFGDIYQASYQGKRVALKRIRTFTADSTSHRNRLQFYKEALVWQGLRHRFVLPLLGIDRSTFAPSFCMVSPWMKHGTVLKYLRDHGREDSDLNRLLLEIAQGLDYLHSMNIVHGDLRGTNILISDDGNVCLSDFGLATSIDDADSTTAGVTSSSNRAGSVRFFAPELIHPPKFGCPNFLRTKASDVYAFACVSLELYTRHPPFSHLREIAASLCVIQGERPEQPPTMPAALWQLVTAAWAQDFRARPSIHNIAIALEERVRLAMPSPSRLLHIQPLTL